MNWKNWPQIKPQAPGKYVAHKDGVLFWVHLDPHTSDVIVESRIVPMTDLETFEWLDGSQWHVRSGNGLHPVEA